MKKIVGLMTLTLIPFVTLLGGCGPGDNKLPFTGSVTTIAGMAAASGVADGSGTMARFNFPTGITRYGTNLYIADSSNDTIRKIDLSASGIPVTTIAGAAGFPGSADGLGTAARFFNPSGITTDGIDVYVAGTFNHTIRRIDVTAVPAGVSTLAGVVGTPGSDDGSTTTSPPATFNFPNGIVRSGNNLYVTAIGNHNIRQIVIATGTVTTFAGGVANSSGFADGSGTAAKFSSPSGIATDGINLYVADTANHAIRLINASGVVSTIAGAAPPLSFAGSVDSVGTNARFKSPVGIVRDGANLYVADSGNNTIRKIEIITLKVTTLAGAANSPFPPPPNSGDGTGAAARFNNPTGITSDGTSLYVTDTDNHTIRRIQ